MEEFRDYWPLSVRAVYYRLLGTGRLRSLSVNGRYVGSITASTTRGGAPTASARRCSADS